MLGKRIGSMKKLAKRVKSISITDSEPSHDYECLLIKDNNEEGSSQTATRTPTGTFAVYVGKHRQRFMVPTGYLSHPLLKILHEKSYDQFGFKQTNGLAVPCSVSRFLEVISAVECCNGKFNCGDLVEEFVLGKL